MSKIPSGIALEAVRDWEGFLERAKQMAAGKREGQMETMSQALDIVVMLCRRPFSFRKFGEWWRTRGVTRRWLIRHTDINQLQRFIALCVDLLFKSLGSGAEEDSHGPPQ